MVQNEVLAPDRSSRASLDGPCSESAAAPESVCVHEAVLDDAPATKSLLMDQVYQEYCSRVASGEAIDPTAFCARHPIVGRSLFKLLNVHQFFGQNSMLVRPTAPSADDEEIAWPAVGSAFGSYKLLVEIARGAFARVFLAADANLGDRLMVIKIAPRWSEEASILGPIKHANIVPVFALEEDVATDLTGVCMPYVGTATLGNVFTEIAAQPALPARAAMILNVISQGAQPEDGPAQATPAAILKTGVYVDGIRLIAAQIAAALAHLHQLGIFHLDLKPTNVLLTPDGVPMLLDFNLATNPTASPGRVGGTPEYMSPEQLRALIEHRTSECLNARSDLFSLGVLLYELLTGRRPFGELQGRGKPTELAALQLEFQGRGFVPVRELNPDVDRGFAQLIESCLALDPGHRPQDAAQVADRLRAGLAPVPRAARWLGRQPRTVMAAMVLALMGMFGVGAAYFRAPYSDRQFLVGAEAYKQGRYKDAVAHFDEVVKADPSRADAYFARGRACTKLGTEDGWRMALADFQLAEARKPDGRNQACIGYCLSRLGEELSNAEPGKHYQDAIDAGYVNAEVLNNLAYCQTKSGNANNARKNLDHALQLNSKLQIALHNRAWVELTTALAILSKMDLNKQVGPAGKVNNDETLRRSLDASLTVGIQHIEKAIASGPPSARLAYDAARLHAIAARVDPAKKTAVIPLLSEGIDKHQLDPSSLQDVLFDPWRDDPAFQKLAGRQRGANISMPLESLQFVDPVKDSE